MRCLLDRLTAVGIFPLSHDLGASLLSCLTRASATSVPRLGSSYAVSTGFRTSKPFKVHAFVPMTSSKRTLHTYDSGFSSNEVPPRPSFASVSTNLADKTHSGMSVETLTQNPPSQKPQTPAPYESDSVVRKEDLTKASKGAPYTPSEVSALLLMLLPESTSGVKSITVKEALHQLPTEMRDMVMNHPGGLVHYVRDHFSQSISITADGMGLLRVPKLPQDKSFDDKSPAAHTVKNKISLSPPPPPRPSTTLAETQHPFSDGGFRPTAFRESLSQNLPTNATTEMRRFRNNIEILDVLVEYIPTFLVNSEAIASVLPQEIKALYPDTSLAYFLKRFKHYFDIRTAFGQTKVRLKENFSHPKRGTADVRYMMEGEAVRGIENRRRPPRNSEANLLLSLLPRVPKEFKPLKEVLHEISDIVSRHPAFDPRLGVMGFLEKYPEYFQVAEGKLRVRPYSVAPIALDELDTMSSPFPAVFAKLMILIDSIAEGKSYHDNNERVSATVSTSKLYAMLTDKERSEIRAVCRSFPRFLRLHGKAIVVSPDNMCVYKFKPEYERCAETLLNAHLSAMEISPDDPILAIPAIMDEDTNADWVFKELYNALPLMQCAELEDVLVLVPDAVREALPRDMNELVSILLEFPDYFHTWPYPDDPSVIIIQRAKIGTPTYEKEEIIRKVLPLIPQEGIKLSALRSRVPLSLQRYFYRYGVGKTLGEMDHVFRISADCIIRMI